MKIHEIDTILDVGDEVITRDYNPVDRTSSKYRQRVSSIHLVIESKTILKPTIYYTMDTWFECLGEWRVLSDYEYICQDDLNKFLGNGERRYEY